MPSREPDCVPPCWRRPDLHLRSARRSSAAQQLSPAITAHRPALDPAVAIRAGTNLEDLWQRFEVFEALHHTMQICNPLTTEELDQVIDAMDVTDHMRVVDFACGYGEVLLRIAARASIDGTGVDLSPWMIAAAASQAHDRAPQGGLSWILGEARDFVAEAPSDRAVCIGAEWVWHDFAGTVRALAGRLTSGGVAVIGAGRLHTDADRDRVRQERGAVETIDDQAAVLRKNGLEPQHRVDPDDAGWDEYLARTAAAAQLWAARYPGPASDRWLEEQADWQAARERDRDVIGWSVWLARRAPKVAATHPANPV